MRTGPVRPDTDQWAARGPFGRTATSWLVPATALMTGGWSANQFVPMIVWYRQQTGFSGAELHIMYASYALGLVPALLFGGWSSDRIGRRVPVLLGVLLGAAGTGLLTLASLGPEWLYTGRLLTGIACGLIFGPGAAWVKELSTGGSTGTGPRRTTIAITTGFAAGPLVVGMIAQWAPAPGTVAYLPHLALSAVTVVWLLRADDSVGSRQHPEDRSATQAPFPFREFVMFLVPFAPWVFGIAAVFLAYATPIVAPAAGTYALLFSAVAAMVGAAAGVAAQPLARWMQNSTDRLVFGSMLFVVLGLSGAAMAVHLRSPVLAMIVSVVCGAAYGLCQLCGLQRVHALARRGQLGTMVSAFQSLSYIGFAFPVILSVMQERLSIHPPVLLAGLSVVALATTAWLPIGLRHTAHRDRSSRLHRQCREGRSDSHPDDDPPSRAKRFES